ncbi:MAG: SDR family NAD(P)-dependent oxidoreductase [Alphaproteobacteria bacterium]
MSKGRVALITGAGGGMGIATVTRFAKEGYRIAAVDLNAAGLKEAAGHAGGAEVRSYTGDLSNQETVRDIVRKIEGDFGQVDALVNLVGWTQTSRFVDEDNSYWTKIIGVNFLSAIYATHAVVPGMIERKSGKIVYVTSDAGRVGQSGEAVYAGMKGGVIAFAKSIARELSRYNINVNCTAPGPTDTPLEHDQDPEIVQRIIKKIPFRRWAKPEEQAAAMAFLCSTDADYITGQVLSVSGGLTMS